MQCEGKSRRTQKACKAFAVKGRRFCRKHGGQLPIGAAHPGFKTGQFSNYLPKDLAGKYDESLCDQQLMEFRADAALLHARLKQLLESCESTPLWQSAVDAFDELTTALKQQDNQRTADAIKLLGNLLRRGVADFLRWREVYDVIEHFGRTKEREHRRLVQMQQMISAEQFGAMILAITDAAKRSITDPASLSAFANELGKLWNQPDKLKTGH